jgi:hypothetical protein
MRILVVEDNESKWLRVDEIIRGVLPAAEIERARDLFEGERAIAARGWDLLILDMSLDIRADAGRAGAAHDYVGGLKILGKMYYDELEVPTIIITGFDSFPTVRTNGDGVMLGLEDVEAEASRQLGDHLVGTVRHLSEGWENRFQAMLAPFRDAGI